MKKTIQNTSFLKLVKDYESFIKVKNYKTGKSNNYQSAVSEFIIWLETSGINKIKEVTSKVSVNYFNYLITRPNKRSGEGTLADSTIKFHLFALGLFMLNLLENRVIENGFYIPPYSSGDGRNRETLTVDEVKTVYQNCETEQEKALLSVAYGCGVRRFEIEALDVRDIKFDSFMLIVRKGKHSKRREVPMSDNVISYLKQYITNERYELLNGKNKQEEALFINQKAERMSGENLNDKLKQMIEQTNNYDLIKRGLTLHSMRHSIAYHLAENNASIEFIRRFLGHVDINTTYIYAIKNKKKKPVITF